MDVRAEDIRTCKIALLVALSCVLQMSESMIPHPVPGLRLGLANMLTLVALVTLGFGAALQIAVLRTVLSSFIMGTFMTPTFILSFSGALLSTVLMGFLFRISGAHKRYRFSLIGISVLGALAHNLVQLFLAYLLLVQHKGIFVFLPWLVVGAVVMGSVTGVVARSVIRSLYKVQTRSEAAADPVRQWRAPGPKPFAPGRSFLHRFPAHAKIGSLILLSVGLLLSDSLVLYAGVFLSLLCVVTASGVSVRFLWSRVRKFAVLLFLSFLLPVFFNSDARVLLDLHVFKFTYGGVITGSVFALRVLLLILASSILVRTTSPEDLTSGLARLLSVGGLFGSSGRRLATTVSLSWTALPYFWELVRSGIKNAGFGSAGTMRSRIRHVGQLIAGLYMEAEPQSPYWENAFKDSLKGGP